MARVKSGFRKRFNIRYWRWRAARATIGQVAGLRRLFSFYLRTALPSEVANEVLEDRTVELPTLFTPDETAFVRDRCWQFDTFAGDWAGEATVPAQRLALVIRNVELLGHVGRILVPSREAVISLTAKKANWNFAKMKRLRQLPRIAGRSHLLARTDNYYHALFHDLLPLVDYLENLHPRGMPLTLAIPPSRIATLALGCNILKQAYPGVRTIELPEDAKAEAEEALWLSFWADNAEWNFADAATAFRLAEMFRAHYGLSTGRGRRIFFTRGRSKIRRLINEEAIWSIVAGQGFERFEARGDNHSDQVRCFSEADIVVGVHGAGLGNLLFCKPGTRVVEIFPENFTKSTYLWLSKRIGLVYDHIVGGTGDYDQAFSLDEAEFRLKMEAALAS
jgi:hypothetical protein